MLLLGDSHQLRAVLGHQLLVGGADAPAALQRPLHEGIGRLHAAHDLHHNLNLRVIGDHLVVVDDLLLDGISREIPQIQHILDVDLLSRFFVNALLVGLNNLHHTASHGAVT